MNKNLSVEKIINYVKKWIEEIEKEYFNVIKVEIINKEYNYFRAIFTLENCMAQIIINEPDFAPYENIMFEAATIENNNYNNIYTWHNCNDENMADIINKLNDGIKFIVNYNREKV